MRYIAFFMTLVFLVMFLRTWVWNLQNMQNSISTIRTEIESVEEETEYMENFRIPYLDSERASYFLWHENWVLYKWEYVVRLRQRKIIDNGVWYSVAQIQQDLDDPVLISSPKESWLYFFEDKLSELDQLWFIFD